MRFPFYMLAGAAVMFNFVLTAYWVLPESGPAMLAMLERRGPPPLWFPEFSVFAVGIGAAIGALSAIKE